MNTERIPAVDRVPVPLPVPDERVQPGRGYLTEQLQRASASIVLNIAEGAGEFSRREKARFYRMAKRSATECAAVLDLLRKLDLVDRVVVEEDKARLTRVVSMLIQMVKAVEPAGHGQGHGRGHGAGNR